MGMRASDLYTISGDLKFDRLRVAESLVCLAHV